MNNAINTVRADSISSFAIPEGALRRRLHIELESIRAVCRNSGLSDEMTLLIQEWEGNFTRDLRFSDEEAVFRTYVEALQELLCDPITEAPYGPLAVIGSDCETYDLMSLAVWRLSVPEEYRDRSPVDPENPALLTVEPHPCVRHMVKWLESHQALLQSEELVTEYLRLLPQRPTESIQERMNSLMARETERQRAATQQLNQQTISLDRQILNRLDSIAAEDNRALDDLSSRIANTAAPLIQLQNEADRVQEEEALSLEGLRERIEGAVRGQFDTLAQRIDAFERDTGEELGSLEERDRQNMAALRQRITALESGVENLTTSTQSLQENIGRVQSLSEIVQQEAKDLHRSIDDVKKAIKKRKIKQLQKIVKTVAVVAATAFASWAVMHYELLPGGCSLFMSGNSSGGSLGLGVAL